MPYGIHLFFLGMVQMRASFRPVQMKQNFFDIVEVT